MNKKKKKKEQEPEPEMIIEDSEGDEKVDDRPSPEEIDRMKELAPRIAALESRAEHQEATNRAVHRALAEVGEEFDKLSNMSPLQKMRDGSRIMSTIVAKIRNAMSDAESLIFGDKKNGR